MITATASPSHWRGQLGRRRPRRARRRVSASRSAWSRTSAPGCRSFRAVELLLPEPVVERHERHTGQRRAEQGDGVREWFAPEVQDRRVFRNPVAARRAEVEQLRGRQRAIADGHHRPIAVPMRPFPESCVIFMRTLFSQSAEPSVARREIEMQISGSSAIVVGGTGGLGEATVRRLHAAGAKVVVADVADDKGKALERNSVSATSHRRQRRGLGLGRNRRGRVAGAAAHLGGLPRWSRRRRPSGRQGRQRDAARGLHEDHRSRT